MIRLWDFATCSCGASHRDTVIDGPRIPSWIKCSCGRRIGWVGKDEGYMRKNQINLTAAGMNYGKFDPQFGCVVEDYGHRQRLLRERGMVEVGGPEKLDDIYASEAPDTGFRNPDVQGASAESEDELIKELTEKLHTDPRVDRKNTGTPREHMLDSWMEM